MRNNKGFTLMELMVVVIVIGILVSVSIPFVLGYSRDARNDRAKAQLYLIAQGYRNFRNDFPWVELDLTSPLHSVTLAQQGLDAKNCDISGFTGDNSSADYTDLIKCSYLNNIKYEDLRYNFYLGEGVDESESQAESPCNKCFSSTDQAYTAILNTAVQPTLACMVGDDGGDYGSDYCAFIDSNNTLFETPISSN